MQFGAIISARSHVPNELDAGAPQSRFSKTEEKQDMLSDHRNLLVQKLYPKVLK